MLRLFRINVRLLLVLMIALLVISACNTTPTETVVSPTEEQVSEEAETEEQAPEPGESEEQAPEEAELTFWMASDPILEAAMDDIFAEFMQENPGVTITREAYPYGDYFQQLVTAFAGGAAPDVFLIDVRTAEFASRDSLLSEAEFITDENLNEILPAALMEGQYQGEIYALPLHENASTLFVNREMAESAGIRIPTSVDEAWTWDEFVEIASQLTVADGDVVEVWGFSRLRPWGDWPAIPIILQNGGQILSPEQDTASGYLNGPEAVEAMTWFQSLFTEFGVAPPDPIPEGFPAGQIAILQAPVTYRNTLESNYPDFEFLVVPLYQGEECAVMTGGWNVAISATTEHTEAAWKVVDWVTREKHQEWIESSGYLPIRDEVMSQPQFSEYPWNLWVSELQQCAVNRPAISTYSRFADVFNSAVNDIIVGGDVKQILDDAAAEIDSSLDQ